ncbi:MAG: DUF488 domain-containing protein [Chloroflexi bacterium]|nr:MAG: DUF488 domain-containing protein [Chloroflexota bacterium]
MLSRSSIRSPLTGATCSHATFIERVFHTECMPSIYSIGHGTPASLAQARIDYVHLRGLGGRRDAALDSRHVALRVDAFRGYADHMDSAEFAADYARLDAIASEKPTAFMCAETLWWRCHRRLLSDRFTVDGWDVVHLLAPGKREPHRLWEVARVVDGRLVYDGGAIPLGR